MGGVRTLQTNFTAGEWSPMLDGRSDLAKFGNAVRKMENMIIYPHGPAQKRPGLRYIAETKDSTKESRLIDFQFSTTQAYILEFGDQYVRFYMNQGQILDGGIPYEIATPYLEADLSAIKYCQSADVLYLWHPDYAPRKITRKGHTDWVLEIIDFSPPPTSEQSMYPNINLTPGLTAGTGVTFTAASAWFQNGDIGRTIKYGVSKAVIRNIVSSTAVTADIIIPWDTTDTMIAGTWELFGSPTGTIQPSAAGPKGARVTVTGDIEAGRKNLVSTSGADDWWGASGTLSGCYYLKNSATPFQAAKPAYVFMKDSQRYEALYTAPATPVIGNFQWSWGDFDTLGYSTIYVKLKGSSDPDSKAPNKPEFVQCAGTLDIFREEDQGLYIIVNGGVIEIDDFIDNNTMDGIIHHILENTNASSLFTLEKEAWNANAGYPSCGTFFEDRLCAGGSTEYPQSVWGSQTGDYENFAPGVDDADGFNFTLSSRHVNKIMWLEPREKFIIGTNSGEWKLGPSDTQTPLTPLNVVAKRQTTCGSADIPPITVGQQTVFVQRAGLKLMEFFYQFEKDGFETTDLTRLAEHITASGVKEIVYQQEPLSIFWMCLEDGSLIGMTYLRAEEVIGWHKHPTDGLVESLATIPGDGYDEVWAIVKRTINGTDKRFVEMIEKACNDDEDTYITNNGLNAFYVDCGLTYDGAPATSITGLDHLEGEEVAILADGSAVASQTVTAGGITLDNAASVVHAGLAYSPVLKPMRIEIALKDGTAQGRFRRVNKITVKCYRSGSFQAGADASSVDEVPRRTSDDPMDNNPPLFTGDCPIEYDGRNDREGEFIITQDNAMPLTIVNIMQDIEVGDL